MSPFEKMDISDIAIRWSTRQTSINYILRKELKCVCKDILENVFLNLLN